MLVAKHLKRTNREYKTKKKLLQKCRYWFLKKCGNGMDREADIKLHPTHSHALFEASVRNRLEYSTPTLILTN